MKHANHRCLLLIFALLCSTFATAAYAAITPPEAAALKQLQDRHNPVTAKLDESDRRVLLATLALKQDDVEGAIKLLDEESISHNRLAALLSAEANRRAALQAARAAGHYAHAVADKIDRIAAAKIDISEANRHLQAFIQHQRQAAHQVKQAKTKPTTTPPALSASIRTALESWRRDWASLDLPRYIAHYHPAFQSGRYNLARWRAHKQRVNRHKHYIHVQISQIKATPPIASPRFGELVRVTFRQQYRSSNYNATSNKQLLLVRKNAHAPWLILFEGDRDQPLPTALLISTP